jgi:hypothetical protein
MKHIVFKFLVPLCLSLFAFSTISFAQQDATVTANVPFGFWVEGTHFQPGDYVIDNTEPAMVIIRSKDGKTIEQAGTILYGDPVAPKNSRLIFVKRNGQFDLAEIWGRLGKRVLTAEYDHNDGDGTRVVQLQYSPANEVSRHTP